MTNDEIMKYNEYKAAIYLNNIKITELESRATKCTAEITGMPHSGGTSDMVGNADYDKISKLREENKYYKKQMDDIEYFIESISDKEPITKLIFRLRVYSNMEWWQISDAISENSEKDTTADSIRMIFKRYLEKSEKKIIFCD